MQESRTERQSRRVGSVARRVALRLGATCAEVDGLHVCTGLPSWAYPRGGITLGDAYLTGSSPVALTPARLRHERVHRDQWRRHGYRFAWLYLRAGRRAETNRWEVEAGLEDGGYRLAP